MNEHLKDGLIIGTLVVLLLLAGRCSAHAEHWEKSGPPECYSEEQCAKIDAWYAGVKQNANEASCCGIADAYWADKGGTDNGKYFIQITDERQIKGRKDRNGEKVFIPSDKIDLKRQGNPSGHTVIFITNYDVVLCFFPTNYF